MPDNPVNFFQITINPKIIDPHNVKQIMESIHRSNINRNIIMKVLRRCPKLRLAAGDVNNRTSVQYEIVAMIWMYLRAGTALSIGFQNMVHLLDCPGVCHLFIPL